MANLKSYVKRFLRACGLFVFRYPPRGVDLFYDLSRDLKRERFKVVFDVGANVGQSASHFLTAFPEARIWCFEPSIHLHEKLEQRLHTVSRIHCENLALGSGSGSGVLQYTDDPTVCYLLDSRTAEATNRPADENETVNIESLDRYCDQSGISSIDFLKIDTEGHDVEVLRGGSRLLGAQAVGVVQCECSMNPENSFHRSLEEIRSVLEGYGYRLFGLYEQVEEFPTRSPVLRRVNAVFASQDVIKRNIGSR